VGYEVGGKVRACVYKRERERVSESFLGFLMVFFLSIRTHTKCEAPYVFNKVKKIIGRRDESWKHEVGEKGGGEIRAKK